MFDPADALAPELERILSLPKDEQAESAARLVLAVRLLRPMNGPKATPRVCNPILAQIQKLLDVDREVQELTWGGNAVSRP